MLISRGYKTQLKPNRKQTTQLIGHMHASRFAYNFCLTYNIAFYKQYGKSPSANAARDELVRCKREDVNYVWLKQYSKYIVHYANENVNNAFKNFFAGSERKNKVGFPKFKSRRTAKMVFAVGCEKSFKLTDKHVRLPKLGWIRLQEQGYLPTQGVKYLRATISYEGERFFIALNVEEERPEPKQGTGIIGVDVGISHMAITSNGDKYDNPRAQKRLANKIARLNRKLARQQKGSANRAKTVLQIQQAYYQQRCIRRDAQHKATTALLMAKTKPAVVVIEDLNLAGMKCNRKLARAISDAAIGEFSRQLKYKADWHGVEIVQADRFYPSSKLCSNCGYKYNELSLSDRHWCCPECNVTHDRDVNAAINLAKYIP